MRTIRPATGPRRVVPRWRATLAALACAGAGTAGAAAPGAVAAAAPQYLALQWGLTAIKAPAAWTSGTGNGVRIGIVDTGVDTSQQDLQGKVVASRVFESSPSSGCGPGPTSAEDDNGHGTHVAGIAAASGTYGVEGAAPGASEVVAKVLDCQGSGNYQDVIDGIAWVVSQGARVVNLSLGDAGTGLVDQSQLTGNPLAGALQDAWNHGAVGVVAAGNNANGVLGLGEANFTSVPAVVVAATGPSGQLAGYSNSIDSAQWGVAAPGGDDPAVPPPHCGDYSPSEILSTYWAAGRATDCYATDEGTSMATPFVSGTLALLLGRGLSPAQAVQTMLATADHTVACGHDCSGLIDAQGAMAAASHGAGAASPRAAGGAPTGAPAPAPPASAAPGPASSTTAPPTAAGGPTTTVPAPRATAAHRVAGARTTRTGGNAWWLALPIGLGLALLLALVIGGRRALVLRHAVTAHPAEGPWPPI